MFNLRSLMPKDARQTLALCIVWGSLAACTGLCLLAPAKHPVDIGPGEPRTERGHDFACGHGPVGPRRRNLLELAQLSAIART